MEIDADQRHVQMVQKELGMNMTAQELEQVQKTPVLLAERAKMYRAHHDASVATMLGSRCGSAPWQASSLWSGLTV
eukprot:6486634-Amphidinium_carterae.3